MALWVSVTSLNAQSVALVGSDAAEDVRELRRLLEVESSYAWLGDGSWRTRLTDLESALEGQELVWSDALAQTLAEVLGDLGDRHASVRARRSRSGVRDPSPRRGELPFALARVEQHLVVLRPGGQRYELFDPELPYLAKVDGVPTAEALATLTPENRSGPLLSRLSFGGGSLRRLGRRTSQDVGETVRFTLSDGLPDGESKTREIAVELVERGVPHADDGNLGFVYRDALRNSNYQQLHRRLSKRIAYIALPSMESFEERPALREALRSMMEASSDADALILDVRSNFGGTREILWELSSFIVPRAASPWVANVAYVRSDQDLDEEIESMTSRYLFPRRSDRFDETDRVAVRRFLDTFTPRRPIPEDRFSEPYLMLLRSGETPYQGWVYVLANEQSTSAASVFVAALKGLPNVTVAGVRTDGSSGRSRRHRLLHSNLEVRLSTMASYQRNGLTLDGHGTTPDLEIDVPLEQRLTGRDLQLEALVAAIEKRLQAAETKPEA